MVYFNEDSSDSESELFTKNSKLSPNDRKKSGKSFETHGDVVNTNKNPIKKSPPKQQVRNSKKINSNDARLRSASKENLKKNYNENDNTSDKEQLARSNTTKIKIEKFSSDDESEQDISKSSNAVHAGNNFFNGDDDETIPRDLNQSMNSSAVNEVGNTFSQGTDEKPTKKRRISIKRKVISSEDDESTHKDSEKLINDGILIQQANSSESESSQGKDAGGNNSEDEIPPSQFWLHEYKDVEKANDNEEGITKMAKKSSLFKNLDFYEENEDNEQEIQSLKAEVTIKKGLSRKNPPPRIKKTEIISKKFKRVDGKIVKDRKDSELENTGHGNIRTKAGIEVHGGWKESIDDDNDSDEKILIENGKFQSNKSSGGKLDIGEDSSEKKASPGKKRHSPKNPRSTSPKRKLNSGPKIPNINPSIKTKANTGKTKKRKGEINNELNDSPFKTRPNICDNDISSQEEEECVERNEPSMNWVLRLKRPRNLNYEASNPSGTQMLLVLKKESEIIGNNASNLSNESKPSSRKASISHIDDVSDEDLPDDSPSNVVSGGKIERKIFLQKRRHSSDSMEGEQISITKSLTMEKQEIIRNRKSTGSKAASLKRKLDPDARSSAKETSLPGNIVNNPLRRKRPESDNVEAKSNKRAKLTTLADQPEHTMSDSDDTDSLTKLNTTLNKSMALMKNETEKVKMNSSRKSVSINTKYETTHTPIDAKSQKSILKKPADVVGNDHSDSSSDSKKQNVQEISQPVNDVTTITPRTIKRPINLQNLKHQENLVNDSTKSSFGLEDISDDDEIYILDVPRMIDPRELKGQTLKLGGKNRLKIGNELYEVCSNVATNISCVFRTDKEQSCYKTVNLRPAGCINMRQKLSKSSRIELPSLGKETVPFPDKLKIRHPLFGAEYEDKILIANKKVSKLMASSMKQEESIARTNATVKVEISPPKLKTVEKNRNQKIKRSNELNRSENISKDTVQRSLNLDDGDSVSNDSDSDGSFFQQVKVDNIGKHEKREKSRNSTSILSFAAPLLAPDVPENLAETVIDVKQKKLSGNKKLGLSLDSSGIKNDSFLLNTKINQFFSSTPIKVENSESKISDSEILSDELRHKKTHDGFVNITKSPKKMKKTNWSMSAVESKKN